MSALLLAMQSTFVTSIVAVAALHRNDVEKDISTQPSDSSGPSEMAAADDDVNSASIMHRKHKKIHRSTVAAAATPASQDSALGSTEGQVPLAPVNPYRKPANPYVAYRNIKMKVNRRRFSINNNEQLVSDF